MNSLYRHRFVGLFVLLLMLSSLACNAVGDDGGGDGGLLLPTVVVTAVSTSPPLNIAPTATLIGGETAVSTSIPRPTPFVDDGSPRMTVYGDLNIRGGPSVDYPRKSFLLAGESAIIVGQDSEAVWWKIECPPRAVKKGITTNCWISGRPRYSNAIHIEDVPELPAP